MDVGTELRRARERAGLSREQVSQETKIQLAKLVALEGNDFSRLPDGLYLNGIVRAYARLVGADGEGLVRHLQAQLAAGPATLEDVHPSELRHDTADSPHPAREARHAAPSVRTDDAAPVLSGVPRPTRQGGWDDVATRNHAAAHSRFAPEVPSAAEVARDQQLSRDDELQRTGLGAVALHSLAPHADDRIIADRSLLAGEHGGLDRLEERHDAPGRREPRDVAADWATTDDGDAHWLPLQEDSPAGSARRHTVAPATTSAGDAWSGDDVHHGLFSAHLAAPPRTRRSAGWLIPVVVLLGAAGVGAYLFQTSRGIVEDDTPSVAASSTPGTQAQDVERAALEGDSTGELDPAVRRDQVSRPADGATDGTPLAPGSAAADDPRAPDTDSGGTLPSRSSGQENRTNAQAIGGAQEMSGGAQGTPSLAHRTLTEPPSRDLAAAGTSRPRGADAATASASTEPLPASPIAPASSAPGAEATVVETSDPAADPAARVEATPELGGIWTLATRIEASSYRNFEGLELGYRLELQQEGNRISGRGVKTAENGRPLAGAAQTPITVQGTIEGQRLTLTFVEAGTRRSSEGKFILDVQDDGVLRGRFASNAARSTGIAEARRPEG